MIKSKINASGIGYSSKKISIRIDATQYVMATLEIMLNNKEFKLPVFDSGRCVGVVYFKDLILFLAHDIEKTDLFTHKLSYTIESAIEVLDKMAQQEIVPGSGN